MTLPREVDVLVLGFGPAGAGAAIAAHEQSARVAIVEKMPAAGGNCLNSGGFLFEVSGPAAVDHLDALCFGKTDRAGLAAFAAGLGELGPWQESLGVHSTTYIEAFGACSPPGRTSPGPATLSTASTTAFRRAGPLNGIVGTPNDYAWSADNSAEVQRGWIKRGETPAELAQQTGLDPGILTETVDAYSRAVAAGRDREFGRAPQSLVALVAPLYAIEFSPTSPSTAAG